MQHADGHGFVQHSDGLTVHFPGDNAEMRAVIARFIVHDAKMAGASAPGPFPAPPAPTITAASGGTVSWQGAALSANYTVQTGPAAGGPWTTVCARCATDSQTPWRVPGGLAAGTWLQVQGVNPDGLAGPFSAAVQASA